MVNWLLFVIILSDSESSASLNISEIGGTLLSQ